ncbi:hypothetical protein BDV12DRAFT_165471 [Aspergillus spectabilis]
MVSSWRREPSNFFFFFCSPYLVMLMPVMPVTAHVPNKSHHPFRVIGPQAPDLSQSCIESSAMHTCRPSHIIEVCGLEQLLHSQSNKIQGYKL